MAWAWPWWKTMRSILVPNDRSFKDPSFTNISSPYLERPRFFGQKNSKIGRHRRAHVFLSFFTIRFFSVMVTRWKALSESFKVYPIAEIHKKRLFCSNFASSDKATVCFPFQGNKKFVGVPTWHLSSCKENVLTSCDDNYLKYLN